MNSLIVFNAIHEPWINAIANNGVSTQLGLKEVLSQSHQLREVTHSLPTVECGEVRLLVALVLDIFQINDPGELADLFEKGRFDVAPIEKYFSDYADRFDLFDAEKPFLQMVMEDESEKPLAGLVSPIPSGTNALHFHHGNEDEFAVCPAAALGLLTTIAPFMTAVGRSNSPSINGAPPFYVLLQGKTLFETILLNCPVDNALFPQAKSEGDVPLWRRIEPVKAMDMHEAGLLQSLTWAPRRIQLIAGQGGCCSVTGAESPVLVRVMKFAPGWSSRFESWIDPHVSYRVTADKRTVLRPQENRPLWRDVGPLALLKKADYESDKSKIRFERPAIVSQFAEMIRQHELPKGQELSLTVYGMRTDLQAKVFEWYRSRLHLPRPLILNAGFASRVQTEIDKADSIACHIGRAIKHTYPRDGAGNKTAFGDLITYAQREFWNLLEPLFVSDADSFLEAIARLTDSAKEEERVKIWRDSVARVGWQVLNAAIEDLDSSADALERQVKARNSFAADVGRVLYPELNKDKKSKTKKGVANV